MKDVFLLPGEAATLPTSRAGRAAGVLRLPEAASRTAGAGLWFETQFLKFSKLLPSKSSFLVF